MVIDITARLGSYADFRDEFRPGDEKSVKGRPLITAALGNSKPIERYAIASFLLDRGVDVSVVNSEGHGVLHVLLGQVRHEVPETAALAARLIAEGADVNLLDQRRRLPIQYILSMPKEDDVLAPLFDLWFSHERLDLTTPNAWGLSPLDLARKVPYRASVVARMERYLAD